MFTDDPIAEFGPDQFLGDETVLRDEMVRQLGVNNVFGMRSVVTSGEAQALLREADPRFAVSRVDIDVDADLINDLLPTVSNIAHILTSGLAEDEFSVSYLLRHRGPDREADSAPHFDTKRSTIEKLADLSVTTGIRLVYQLIGEKSTAGIHKGISEPANKSMALHSGDGWAIPQDRFIGLPLLTREGKVVYARHPYHFALSRSVRTLLIQEIELPLGVVLPALHLGAREVHPNIPVLSGMERRVFSSPQMEQVIDTINARYAHANTINAR